MRSERHTGENAPSKPRGELLRVARHFLPPLSIAAAVALCVHLHWQRIPPQFAVHWTINGIPNGWADKTAVGIYGWLLFDALIVLALAGLSLGILLRAHRRNVASVTLSLLTVVAYTVTTGFSLPAIIALRSVHHFPLRVLVAILAALMIAYFMLLNRIIFRMSRLVSGR